MMADGKDLAEEVLEVKEVEESLGGAMERETVRDNELLEENMAAMEEFIKRTILADDSEVDVPPTGLTLTGLTLTGLTGLTGLHLYEATCGFSVPPPAYTLPPSPALSPPSVKPPGVSLFKDFDPWKMSLCSGGRKSRRNSPKLTCGFCETNGEPASVFRSHQVREGGRVVCPQLRKLVCQLCGGTGDEAHTKSYCPFNSENKQPLSTMLRNTVRKSDGTLRRSGYRML